MIKSLLNIFDSVIMSMPVVGMSYDVELFIDSPERSGYSIKVF